MSNSLIHISSVFNVLSINCNPKKLKKKKKEEEEREGEVGLLPWDKVKDSELLCTYQRKKKDKSKEMEDRRKRDGRRDSNLVRAACLGSGWKEHTGKCTMAD